MLEGNPNLLVPKGNPTGSPVIVESQAYTALMRAVRIGMPSATAGALVGRRWPVDGQEGVVIEEAEAVELVPRNGSLAADLEEWANLRAEVEASVPGRFEIVGWFYADSTIGTGPKHIDIQGVQRTILPQPGVFLLINPSAEQGSFYVWEGDTLVPTGGYFESVPSPEAFSIIPWNGQVTGASEWLASEVEPLEAGARNAARPSTNGFVRGNGIPADDLTRGQTPIPVPAANNGKFNGRAAAHAPGAAATSEDHALDALVEDMVAMQPPGRPQIVLEKQESPQVEQSDLPARESGPDSHTGREIEIIPRGERWPGELAPLFDVGFAAYEQGNWDETRHFLSQVVRREPGYARNGQSAASILEMAELFELGIAAYRRGNLDSAHQTLAEIVRLRPESSKHRQLAARMLEDVDEKLAAERRRRKSIIMAGSILPFLCVLAAFGALALPGEAPLHRLFFGDARTPVTQVLPLTSDTPTPAAAADSGNQAPGGAAATAEAQPTQAPAPPTETPTALPPTATPAPPTPTPTKGPPPEVVALAGISAAEEAVRTGQVEADIENADGSKSTALLQFSLGQGNQEPAYHLYTVYESTGQSQGMEHIAVGDKAWQRKEGGAWSEVPEQEGAWVQLQTYLPKASEVTGATLESAPAGEAVLRWYDASRDADTVLRFDPATGVPLEMQRVSRATGSKLTITYSGWNLAVLIEPPDTP